MKKGILILVLALMAGIAAFWFTRSHQQAAGGDALLDGIPELAWLRGELDLTDEQFDKAIELHIAYRPLCVEMCRRIADTHAKVEALARESREMSPELEQATLEHARVHAECQRKMLTHLYETAALMNERQAARYLEIVLPSALNPPASPAAASHHH